MGRKRKRDSVDQYCATKYVFEGDIRFVEPYIHEYKTFAKGRWYGRSLSEVLLKEFGGHQESYWMNAITMGHVRINNAISSPLYQFKNNDVLIHRTHRHEPPVVGHIALVGETDDILAVSKPPSMPMHPCGAYRYNSLMTILSKSPLVTNQPPLHLVHRLDRVTSGLVILAKSKAVASKLAEEIRKKHTKKFYLARVRGKFPGKFSHLHTLTLHQIQSIVETVTDDKNNVDDGDEDIDNKINITDDDDDDDGSDNKKSEELPLKLSKTPSGSDDIIRSGVGDTISQDQEPSWDSCPDVGYFIDPATSRFTLCCPIRVVSYRDGMYSCHPNGKVSVTSFLPIGYNETDDTTLVECRPWTGRTHQIRLHLQLLGNPIANDPCYGGRLFYGETARREKAVQVLGDMRRLGHHPLSKVPHLEPDVPIQGEQAGDDGGTVSMSAKEGAGGGNGVMASDWHIGEDSGESERGDTGFSEDQNIRTLPLPPESETSSLATVDGASHGDGDGGGKNVAKDVVFAEEIGLHTAAGGVLAVMEREEGETDDQYLVRTCRYCKEPNSVLLEQLLHCDGIWLHALRYEGAGWGFEAPWPNWANLPCFDRYNSKLSLTNNT